MKVSLKEVEQKLKEVTSIFKKSTSDQTLGYLMKQHSRAEFICFAFLALLSKDLQRKDDLC